MAKTKAAEAMDHLQSRLRPFLNENGFRMRARTCNRTTSDGLTHVINFQMGRFDPPGTYEIIGFRENLYGKFTVNVGIYVPEVAIVRGLPARSFVQETDCCVRQRLGQIADHADLWWDLPVDEKTLAELRLRIERDALVFLERFQDRDRVLRELEQEIDMKGGPPRISRAIILANRGENEMARALLIQQLTGVNARHVEYVQEIADRLNIGKLNPDITDC